MKEKQKKKKNIYRLFRTGYASSISMALKYSLKVNRSMIVNNLAYIFYFHSILIFTHIYIYHPKLFIPLYIYIYVYKSFVVLVRVYMREILEYILTIIRYKMKSFSKNHSMNLLSIEDKR